MESELVDRHSERAEAARERGEIIRYGTTGLRFNGEDVISVSFRCGVVVGLLSKAYHPHKIGTAGLILDLLKRHHDHG